MLKMRLQRIGRRNDASFRVIVTDSRSGPKSGKNVALLGSYDPKQNRFQIDADAAKDWIAKGVQVSDTVHNLLVSKKVIDGKKRNALPRKSPIVSEEAQQDAVTTETSGDEASSTEEVPTESAEQSGDASSETDGGSEDEEAARSAEESKQDEAPGEESKDGADEASAETAAEEEQKG